MADLAITSANVVADSKAKCLYGLCGEAINPGQAVYKSSTAKKWLKADSNSPEAEVRKAIGIALNVGSLNQPLKILRQGKITIGATLVTGATYYLSDNPGGICTASDVRVGDYICLLGIATSTAVLDVKIQFPNVVSGTVGSISAIVAQTVSQLAQAVMAAHGADWFVDSVAGSDSNNGTSSATSFATLAALSSAVSSQPTKTIVALKRGSHFREDLSQSVTSAFDYGNMSDPLPIIDGSDVVTGWTVNGTYATVWEKTTTTAEGGRPRIFEDGALMTWAADVATCATTAGSRVLLEEGGTVTLQIHPSDGGNPNTNGKTYEVTMRRSPILLGSNCSLKGIHSQRAVSNNGCIEMGMNAYLERCLAVDGSKHNMLIGSGDLVDVIAVRTDDLTPAQPAQAYIVGFGGVNSISGHSFNMTRCGVMSDRSGTQLGVAFIDHGSTGGEAYTDVNLTQCWAVDCQSDFQSYSVAMNAQGYYLENVSSFMGSFSDALTISNAQVNLTQTDNLGTGRSTTGLSGSFYAHFTDIVIYALTSPNGLFRATSAFNGGDLNLTNVAVYSVNPGQIALADTEGWSSGTLELNGNIFISNNGGSTIQVPSGVTYTGNHNSFGAPLGSLTGANFKWHGGSALIGLASWRSASGQDANSLEFNPGANLFPGGASGGDFRLGGNVVPTALKGINAGPQHHWDWNARAQASGAPSRWPIVPKTLADAIAYVKNPASWNWGADSTLSTDSTVDAFTFTDVTGVPVSTDEISNLITVSGLDVGVSVSVSVTGGQYSKNGGTYTSAAGTAVNGDTFRVKQTSSASNATTTNTVLTIGGVSDTYSVTTITSSGPPPTLSANFLTTSSLPAWMTLSRASTGDYHDASGSVQTASNDVPRFDHDATSHVALGLMVMNAGGTQSAADNVQLVGSALSILQGTAYSIVLRITDTQPAFYADYLSVDNSGSGPDQSDVITQYSNFTDRVSSRGAVATLLSGTVADAMSVGFSTDGSGLSLVANGGTVASDSVTPSRSITAAAIGARLSFGGLSQFSNMHLAAIELYDTRLSDSDLQAKTV